MPKFTTTERETISANLFETGEKLFCEYGLRKLTVEKITMTIGIAKGSFYAFYESKEALYFDILVRYQQDMWQHMATFVEENKLLAPRPLVSATIMFMFELMAHYPLIQKTDDEALAILFDKLPQSIIQAHTSEDQEAIGMLLPYVNFTQPLEVVAKSFQALYGITTLLANEDRNLAQHVLAIFINGLVNELVEESR